MLLDRACVSSFTAATAVVETAGSFMRCRIARGTILNKLVSHHPPRVMHSCSVLRCHIIHRISCIVLDVIL